jgi:hypothetical protein
MRRTGIALSVGLGLALSLCPFVLATEFVGPNEEGSIELPITNDGEGVAPANGVRLFAKVVPDSMASSIIIDQAGSTLGPFNLDLGQAQTFILKYKIGPNVHDGDTFEVVLYATATSQGFLSEDAVNEDDGSARYTSVMFRRSAMPFIDGNSTLPV